MKLFDGKYQLIEDNEQVTVSRRSIPKKEGGKVRYINVGYFSHMFNALMYVARQELNKDLCESDTVLDMATALTHAETRIKEQIEAITKCGKQ